MDRMIKLESAPALGDFSLLAPGDTLWIAPDAPQRKDWSRYVALLAVAICRGADVRWMGGEAVMARRMVGDDQDVYRVVVLARDMIENPHWVRGVYDPENNPRRIPSGEPKEYTYGPYNTIGAARGQATHHREYCGKPYPDVVSVRIQKATVAWADVDG